MEHPPKQGLKREVQKNNTIGFGTSFNGTSTKTRIETPKPFAIEQKVICFNGTSTKTRIETDLRKPRNACNQRF